MYRKLGLTLLLASAACADQPLTLQDAAAEADGPVVMTRNLYLGADLDPVIGAASPAQVPLAAAQAWAAIRASNFPERAGVIADEIARANADVVGLQEVALYHLQSPGDAALGGNVPATSVAYDFLQLVLDSLSARGLTYHAVAQSINTQVELPVYTGGSPVPFDDVRFTDRDVIIARSGVTVTNPQAGVFAARLTVPAGGPGGPPITQLRGWASIDVTMHGKSFRFMSTHFEVQRFAPIQAGQAAELIGIANMSPLPIVLVGDINSAADGSQTPTYGTLVNAGFVDSWTRANDGSTCCHLPDLSNTSPALDQRIDVIMLRGFDRNAVRGVPHLVGDKVNDRTRSGLWPSDHAGITASLRLR